MSKHALLDHILGDYSDKLKALPTASQPELTEMINDLSQVSYNHHDGKNTLQAIDLWESALTNPSLTEENLIKLFPLVFRLEQYSVRQINPLILDSRLLSDQICKNLISLNFSDNIWLTLFQELLVSPKEFTKQNKMLNKKTGDLIKGLNNCALPNLKQFLKTHKENKIKSLPTEQLLQCTKSAYRTYSFDPLFVFNVTKDDVKNEINRRKQTIPKDWKNYTTQDFLPFFTFLQSTIQKAKLERRNFFKILKNRLWTKDDLIKENETYLETLEQIEFSIQEQKELIKNKLKNLKADSTRKTD